MLPLSDEETAVDMKGMMERQNAEETLRDSNALYRTLFESANDAIFLMNDDCFVDCNAQTLKMFGCAREQIIGHPPYEFSPDRQPDGSDSKEKAVSKIQAALHEGPQFFEWLHCRLDKSPFHAEVSLTRMELDADVFLMAIVRDVTERKNAEEQEKVLRERLDRAERFESLVVLAGGVAHDLNNILGPLVGYPELILRKLPPDSSMAKQVQRMADSAQQAADVVQDLLTLARRGRYEMTSISLNDVITAYLDSPGYIRLTELHRGVALTCRLDASLGRIHGSACHLSKVIMNLVVNAYEAMPNGGAIEISTSQEYRDKLLSGHANIEKGDFVLFRIRDTGPGINQEDLVRIFEPYYSKKAMGISGSGLGLSVVYGVVKDHKGHYDVFSEVGKGTEIVLYFPVAREADDRSDGHHTNACGSEAILVVDDAASQREVAAELLSSLGYCVATAENGHAALDYLRVHQVDLVVLDMIMEDGFDGLDTFREIKKIRPSQKAIIATGFSPTDRVHQALKIGAGAYVRKPFTREDIGRAVRRTLDGIREPHPVGEIAR